MDFALSERARAAGYRLQSFEEVGSTNAEALAFARSGEVGPVWITARRQTAGRGRRGRGWQTLQGNLATSLLLTVAASPATAATLSLVAGLAAVEALRACAPGLEAGLKWPNDIVADEAKLAGILLESEPAAGRVAVAIGIGINLATAPSGLAYEAVSLAGLGRHVRPEPLFTALADAWLDYAHVWDDGRGMPRIRNLWLAYATGIGREITVQLGERLVHGTFETIDDEGRLILIAADGQRTIVSAGEVLVGPRAARDKGTA
jgi:BirA family biotin operon repressor/biotin-[acetyl-CoA-carboxylase] ligase